jgi:hypothetical protein
MGYINFRARIDWLDDKVMTQQAFSAMTSERWKNSG